METGRIRVYPAEKGPRFILLTGIIAAFAFLVVSPIAVETTVVSDPETSTTLRFIAQTIVMFVSIGVFFIQWLPPRQLNTAQSIFIASGFLSTGILTFAHIMTCSMLLNTLEDPESPIGSFFHMMSGVTMAASLLIAAYIPHDRKIKKGESNIVLLAFITYTLLVGGIAMFLGSSFPSLCPHDVNADPWRTIVEIGTVAVLLVATAMYYRIERETKDLSFCYLGCATLLGAYSHAAFSLHQSPYDLYSVLSMLFIMTSFMLVFLALFTTSVTRPYESLRTAQDQAERRRKEAEAAMVKAHTYLDFLSHDIANMISPIMSRAELILQSPNVPEENRDEARRIVEQTQKVASLIVNLRRLSSAEKIDPKTLGSVDLRSLLRELENTRRAHHPNKILQVTARLPEDTPVEVLGGSVAEEMITEVFDNVILHSKKNLIEIEVNVSLVRNGSSISNWRIEILDHGPGIPDHTKSALDIAASDPKKRYTRGIASSLSIMPLIAEQLGGRMRIEDRVPGDHTQGTKVIIVLPRAT